MNERILKLAKQCGYWTGQTVEMNDVGIEKFVELIVRECANLADEPTSQPFKSYGEKIKEHFGVEE